MKRSILLAAMALAAAVLAGCGHPNDITDEISAATVPATQA
jgi:outer membrane murein-binding lipoprotein Lpp